MAMTREELLAALESQTTIKRLRDGMVPLSIDEKFCLIAERLPKRHYKVLAGSLGLWGHPRRTARQLSETLNVKANLVERMLWKARRLIIGCLESDNPEHNPFAMYPLPSNPSIQAIMAEVLLFEGDDVSAGLPARTCGVIKNFLGRGGRPWDARYCDELCARPRIEFVRESNSGKATANFLDRVLALFNRHLGDRVVADG